MINKIKKITAYFLLLLGIVIGIKTIPSVIHTILYQFNIKNTISMDVTNCQTIGYSITTNQFFYALFIFALLCILVGLLLLFRERKLTFNYNYFNFGFLIIFLILFFQSIALLSYIYLLMLEDSLFNTHIIYTIAFTIGLCTNILFLILYSLIWLDTTLSDKVKLIFILILCCFSIKICVDMTSFIYLYGLIESDLPPDTFFEGFDYVLNKLGISTFCMEDTNNPCYKYLVNMHEQCETARDAKSIPKVPYFGSSYTLRWIARIVNGTSTIHKQNTQKNCNNARKAYWECMDFFSSTNNKKK